MLRTLITTAVVAVCCNAQADDLTSRYMARLDSTRQAVKRTATNSTYNPYCIQLFAPGTLYRSALHQTMTTGNKVTADQSLKMYSAAGNALMHTYVAQPQLIGCTEEQLDAEEAFITPTVAHAPEEVKLSTEIMEPEPTLPTEAEDVQVVVQKPNFWKFTGDASLQLTQNYFSDNWYQGGDNFYSVLALANLKLLFDNKQGLQWETILEMKLGFQTNKGDTVHSVKSYNDQLRFTSKVGYKAAKNWNYAAQVQTWTQFLPSYNTNSKRYSARFAAPLDFVASLGMDWKVDKKRFKASLYIAPIAYSMRYVRFRHTYHKNDHPFIYLTSHHGVEDGERFTHNYGPNVTFKYTWEICQNVKWDSRLYLMSDMHRMLGEFENTFTFTINKYLNSKLYLYPRFDDASYDYKNNHGRYMMYKEWLSLGVNYTW